MSMNFGPHALGGAHWVIALVGFVVWLAIVVGIIALIVLGIRWLIRNSEGRSGGTPASGDDTALALLRQRYARGEIDSTEFEERKRTLGA
jgi:putative membrane protein